MRIDYVTPIFDLYPKLRMDIHWSIKNPFDYDTLEWNVENVEKPSQAVLAEKSVEIYYEQEVNEYKGQRGGSYPKLEDQLDQIYHEGIDAWKATIREVKDTYPKILLDSEELQRRKQEVLNFLVK
jgi:hypothetical protein